MNDFNPVTNPKPGPAHLDILNEAMRSITDHNVDYGEPAKNYERAAALASMILNKTITPHEIMIIKLAVKLSRVAENPDLRSAYVELIACASLAGEFANAGPISTKRMAMLLKSAPIKMGAFSMPRAQAEDEPFGGVERDH